MDDSRFDDLTRRLAKGMSRRAMLRGILGGGIAAAGITGQARTAAGEKTILCHATGSGENPWQIITVSSSAVDEHLAHGDLLLGSTGHCGACGDACSNVDACTPARCDGGVCNTLSNCQAVDACTSARCDDDGVCNTLSDCQAADACTPAQCNEDGACNTLSACQPVDACTPASCSGDGFCNAESSCQPVDTCTPARCDDGSCNAASNCEPVDACTPAQCNSDGICNAESNCQPVDACTPALCQEDGSCKTESDCTPVDACTPASCETNESCNAATSCTGFNTCGGGLEADECGCTPVCEVTTCAHDGCGGSCAQDCPEHHACIAGRCFRIQTESGLPRCPFEGVAPCTGSGPEGIAVCVMCSSLNCSQPCTSTAQCPAGEVCSYLGMCHTSETGFCVTGYQPSP